MKTHKQTQNSHIYRLYSSFTQLDAETFRTINLLLTYF